MKEKISIVIITLNEAAVIERCIQSVLPISDDIVVVDSESTDNTVELAEKLGARVFVQSWEGYGQNKNIGNDKAKYDWILSLDADEVVDENFVAQLKQKKLNVSTIYSVLNQLIFCDHWVKYTDWHPSYKKRLFNKKFTRWNTEDVHEGLEINKDTKFEKLSGKILHYGYTSVEQLTQKTRHYAILSATKLYNANLKPSFLKRTFGPMFRFIKSYIIQLGFLDGKTGLLISRMNYNLVKWRYKTLREMFESSND